MAHRSFADMKTSFKGRLLEEEPDAHENLLSLASDGKMEDMFSMMWNLDLAHECLTPNLRPSGKSEAYAMLKLEQGRRLGEEGRFAEALQCLNEGLMFAPHPPVTADSRSGNVHTQTKGAVVKRPSNFTNDLLFCESSDEDCKTISSSVDSDDYEHVQVKSECSSSEEDFERLSKADAASDDNDSSVTSSEEEINEEGFAMVKPQPSADEKCVVG